MHALDLRLFIVSALPQFPLSKHNKQNKVGTLHSDHCKGLRWGRGKG